VSSSPRSWRGSLLLLIAAMIWGSAFVAQRFGAEHMAFASFTAVRHALVHWSCLSWSRSSTGPRAAPYRACGPLARGVPSRARRRGGAQRRLAAAASRPADHDGRERRLHHRPVHGLHPHRGLARVPQRASRWTWLGAALGLCGLYLLSVRSGFTVNVGDLLVLGCAVFWTGHILALERLGALDPFRLCVVQFATCAVISLVFAVAFRADAVERIAQTLGPLAYAAFLSTGVGFTLQVVGQRDAPASHAALIMALEAVFAAIGGALVLGERMDLRGSSAPG